MSSSSRSSTSSAIAGAWLSPSAEKMFDGIRMTMKYYFDVLDVNYTINLFVNGVDEKGAILKHPKAMQEARRLGIQLVTDEGPTPEEPEDVELYQ